MAGKKQVRTWLVTGCSTGIGRGIAWAALRAGYRVAVTARKMEHYDGVLGKMRLDRMDNSHDQADY